MTELFALQHIPQRMKQLEVNNYHLRYRDIVIPGSSTVMIEAYNELYFMVNEPPLIIVESDYGVYDSASLSRIENIYQHRGEISIINDGAPDQKIKFIQVIIVN